MEKSPSAAARKRLTFKAESVCETATVEKGEGGEGREREDQAKAGRDDDDDDHDDDDGVRARV